MLEIQTLLLFMGVSALLALSPGPDIIYVITQGITRGKKASVITSLGLSTGVLVHTTAAALGISVIFQTSQIAFDIVKYLGAGYLFYLAFMAYKHRKDLVRLDKDGNVKEQSFKALYLKGFLMNVLNPKVSIFFLAFLPQFVSTSGNVALEMVQLGVAFMVVTLIVFCTCGVLANKGSSKLMQNPSIATKINTIASAIFFGLGVKLIFTQQ